MPWRNLRERACSLRGFALAVPSVPAGSGGSSQSGGKKSKVVYGKRKPGKSKQADAPAPAPAATTQAERPSGDDDGGRREEDAAAGVADAEEEAGDKAAGGSSASPAAPGASGPAAVEDWEDAVDDWEDADVTVG